MTIIKTLFNEIKNYILVHNNDLSFLDVGDVIWAKRYKEEEDKDKIEIGHRESPYVIIKQTIDKTYALQCTSNPHDNIKWNNIYYPLNKLLYGFNRNTYVNTTTIYELKNIQYVRKISHLSNYDLNKLKKHLYILLNSNYKYKPKIDLKSLKFDYEIGDIILYNKEKYYIYDIDSKKFLTHKLNKKLKLKNRILINNTYYSFRFDTAEEIKKSNSITLFYTFNSGEVKLINEFKEKKLENIKKKKNVISKVGALILYNNNLYYITTENNESFNAYRIHTSKEKSNKMALLKIDGGHFYTNFNLVKILKSKEYKIKRRAKDEEIEYNQKLFGLSIVDRAKTKLEAYKEAKEIQKRSIDYFIPMTIITDKNNNKKYLILSKEENTIELVNINDFSDYFYFYLEEETNSYEYYRIMAENEFLEYKKKINEFKELVRLISN